MYSPKSIYTKLAYDSILSYIKKGVRIERELKQDLLEKKACFVSIHKQDGSLRGCIGTILPYRENLYEEIVENSILAASKDPRFQVIKENELDEIEVSVDILSEPELIKNLKELDCKKYGIIVSDGKFKRGVLLPDLEGVKSVKEQIYIAKSKAGIEGEVKEIYRFTSSRFY